MAMLRPYDVLLRYLETDMTLMAEVHDVASGQDLIWAGGMPDVWMDRMPLKSINIITDAGPTDTSLKLFRPMIPIECYGPTMDEAWEVYLALCERNERQFNNVVVTADGNAYMYRLHQTSSGMEVIEPELKWPKVVSMWEMTFWRETVP